MLASLALSALALVRAGQAAWVAVPLEAAPFYAKGGARHGVFVATYDEDACIGRVSTHIPGCLVGAPATVRGLGQNYSAFATAKGPDSFYIRVQGRESVSLALRDLSFDNCTYTTRPFELRRAGRYQVQVWHLYDNYGAWKIDDAAWPPYIDEYMAIVRDEEVLPPSHTTVLTCNRPDDEHARSRLPLCSGNAHVPGRWVEAGRHRALDWASMTHRHLGPAQELRYEADNCLGS